MTAPELRAAADKLDALADAATPGPWRVQPTTVTSYAEVVWDDPDESDPTYTGTGVASTSPDIGPCVIADAAYIAAMHPGIGQGFAEVLRSTHCSFGCDDRGMRQPYCSACSDSTYDHDCPAVEPCTHSKDFRSALAVARVINGGAQ